MKLYIKKATIIIMLILIVTFNTMYILKPISLAEDIDYNIYVYDSYFATIEEGYNELEHHVSVDLQMGLNEMNGSKEYMKVELTDGDIEAFKLIRYEYGRLLIDEIYEIAEIYPVKGLKAGNYSAQITVFYDRDGAGTDYTWEPMYTSEVTLPVKTPAERHKITVINGTSDKLEAAEGATVTITANKPEYKKTFDKWEVKQGMVSFASEKNNPAQFTMPNTDVAIEATYVDEIYEATIDDLDLGVAESEDYLTGNFEKGLRMTNTGTRDLKAYANKNIKIELTDGDVDEFTYFILEGRYMREGESYYKARFKPVEGLKAGTYSATATVFYDRDGEEVDYGWEVLDTAKVTFTVKGSSTPTETTYKSGDVNGDGRVNAGDYVAILNYVRKKIVLTDEQLQRADANGDGKVNAGDYVTILNIVRGKI